MANSAFIPKNFGNTFARVACEKYLIDKHYNFLTTTIRGNELFVRGICTPSVYSNNYEYKVIFRPGKSPKAFATKPAIAYNGVIHMYPADSSLCLYYPDDRSWKSTSHVFDTVIPWTHEWFLFYELYLITGKWQHPAVSHNLNKIQIN